MNCKDEFYICIICFNATNENGKCHDRDMIHFQGYPEGHTALKPLTDDQGKAKSFMPKWFIDNTQVAVE